MQPDKEGKMMFEMNKKRVQGVCMIGAVLVFIAGALAVPFVYESQTLWYKMGADKIFLRAGQLAGLLTLVSLLVQILLGGRAKVLNETFGTAVLMAWHRTNGILLCCLAVGHVVLVLLPEGMTNLPLGAKHWPEMLGGVLLVVVIVQTFSSYFRQQLGLNYKKWRTAHRVLGYLALILVVVHVLSVADSFAKGLPKIALLGVVLALVLGIAISKISMWRMK